MGRGGEREIYELGKNDATSLDLVGDEDLGRSGGVSVGDLVEGRVGEERGVGGSEGAVCLEQDTLVLAVLLELVLRVEGVKLDLVDGRDDGPSLGELLDVRDGEVADSDGLEGRERSRSANRTEEATRLRSWRAASTRESEVARSRKRAYLDLGGILVDLLHLSPSLVLVELLLDGSSSILVQREVVVGLVGLGLEVNGPVNEVEIHVVNSEHLERLVKALLDSTILVGVPDPEEEEEEIVSEGSKGTRELGERVDSLGGDEDLRPGNSRSLDTISNLGLVSVDEGTVEAKSEQEKEKEGRTELSFQA